MPVNLDNLPLPINNIIFLDHFGLTESLNTSWTKDSGTWRLKNWKAVASTIGELLYDGTAFSALTHDGDTNVTINIAVPYNSNYHFEIRYRRQDANNFVRLAVDMNVETVSLQKVVSGVATTLDAVSHPFHDYNRMYFISLWNLNSNLYGFVNSAPLVQATDTSFDGEEGLSLSVPEIILDTSVIFKYVIATSLEVKPDESLNDTDLIVRHRKILQDAINNPGGDEYGARTWESYKEAYKAWTFMRNFTKTNEAWGEAGYPLRKPSTEEWFA